MTENLIEDQDYYTDQNGNMVFTKEYHLKRGYCCQSGCKHCPYGVTASTCPYCLSKKQTVYVHGHYQCQNCGINIDPCCGGEYL